VTDPDVRARLATVKDHLQCHRLFALTADQLDQLAASERSSVNYSVQVVFCRDGQVRVHNVARVTEAEADLLRIAWASREGDGLTFRENATSQTWFYFWHEIRDVNIAPL
jgi:hypothetical protein